MGSSSPPLAHRSAVCLGHAAPWTRRGELLRCLPGGGVTVGPKAAVTGKCNVLDSGRGRPVRRTLGHTMRGLFSQTDPRSLDRGSSTTK